MATKTQIKTEIKKEPFRPKFYKVILLNDDVTTMDFVVAILVKIFEKSVQDAVDIMFKMFFLFNFQEDKRLISYPL